jgi:hypothetical protein
VSVSSRILYPTNSCCTVLVLLTKAHGPERPMLRSFQPQLRSCACNFSKKPPCSHILFFITIDTWIRKRPWHLVQRGMLCVVMRTDCWAFPMLPLQVKHILFDGLPDKTKRKCWRVPRPDWVPPWHLVEVVSPCDYAALES